jgi:hypothetical protein
MHLATTAPTRKSAPSVGVGGSKNRAWDFFGDSVSRTWEIDPQVVEAHLEESTTDQKTASGVPHWPSRDPIGEKSFRTVTKLLFPDRYKELLGDRADVTKPLYVFVQNNPANEIDVLGLDLWSNISQGAWCIANPRCCKWAKDMKSDIQAEQQNMFTIDPDNGIINAIKHCALMCRIAAGKCCTDGETRKLGNAHENFWGDNDNAAMDLHNNDVGIEVSRDGMTLDKCYARCRTKARQLKLKWTTKADSDRIETRWRGWHERLPETN